MDTLRIFFQKRKSGALPMTAGFTLIELMVTVAIFVAMTALLVARYGSFNDGSILTSTAYDIALTLRDAQSYGLNVQSYNSTNQFGYPYGVDFVTASSKQMILFADVDGNHVYGGGSEAITTYTLNNGSSIKSICAGTGPGAGCTGVSQLDISFKRPNPNAIIMSNGTTCTAVVCSYAEIKVQNGGGTASRTIIVRQTGEIAVQNQ